MKKALITGITGQDGAFLSELLLSKGYKVYGIKRRTSTVTTSRIEHLLNDVEIIEGDLLDSASLVRAVDQSSPDEVYNLGAQSYVKTSFGQPELTGEITGLGTTRLIEAIRERAPKAKFYQASSSEMFGKLIPPHNESTPFWPRSPYGAAKVYAHWMTVNFREQGFFACNGILYNHESHRRGAEFVTQKIARGVAAIKLGHQTKLFLGNLDARRDWGHARDFVEAMWLMLQQDKPDDYVVATGTAHSVREFAERAFAIAGLNYLDYVEVSSDNMRPTEVDYLVGDSTKARQVLGWTPKATFDDLVREMVEHAIENPHEWKTPVSSPRK